MGDSALHWPEIYTAVGPCIRPGGTLLTERALEICTLPDDARIADIGCGAGGTLQYLEQAASYRLVGIDQSETLLAEAAKIIETAQLIQGRAETIPFSNETFDALFCECVLSILDDKQAAFAEFARVLKEDGFLVLSDVFSKDGHGQAGSHSHALTQESLIGLLAAHGFTLLVWEAHERLLKEFAVRMILAGDCLPDSWRYGQGEKTTKAGCSGISYFLLVARKSEAAFQSVGQRKDGQRG